MLFMCGKMESFCLNKKIIGIFMMKYPRTRMFHLYLLQHCTIVSHIIILIIVYEMGSKRFLESVNIFQMQNNGLERECLKKEYT